LDRFTFSGKDNGQEAGKTPPEAWGDYKMAPEVVPLAKEVIDKYHPHLAGADIVYLFRAGKWCSRRRTVKGKALVASQLWRFIGGCDLVLVLSEVIYQNLSEEGKVALLDHELSRFGEPATDNRGVTFWTARDHDVREFSAVVKRHNICMSGLKNLTNDGACLEQLDFMKTLADTVENVEAVAAVYNQPVEIDDDSCFCELEEEDG